MSASSHRFTIGRLQCTIVPDGMFAYAHPVAVFFASAPPAELAQALQALVFVFHFPASGLGRTAANGDGWLWQPIE